MSAPEREKFGLGKSLSPSDFQRAFLEREKEAMLEGGRVPEVNDLYKSEYVDVYVDHCFSALSVGAGAGAGAGALLRRARCSTRADHLRAVALLARQVAVSMRTEAAMPMRPQTRKEISYMCVRSLRMPAIKGPEMTPIPRKKIVNPIADENLQE